MQFEEVVNPHYAFPVVGVILCALLVFAFGFKSPVQPPSFDQVIQEDRKASKKKKMNQKHKSLQNEKPLDSGANIKVLTSLPKQFPDQPQHSKQKAVVERLEKPKIEVKAKKDQQGKVVKQKEMDPISSTESISLDDGGEWVQLLSKKEKKNRRKEENLIEPILEMNKELPSEDTESKESTPAKKKKQKAKREPKGIKDLSANIHQEEKTSTSEIELSPKSLQISKTREDKENLSPVTICNSTASKETFPRGPDEQVASVTASMSNQSKTVIEEETMEKKKNEKKKTKKNQQETVKTTVSDNMVVASSDDLAQQDQERRLEAAELLQLAPETENSKSVTPLIGKKTIQAKVGSDGTEKQADGNKSSTNAEFDELGDIKEDLKPQKKKKVRRE